MRCNECEMISINGMPCHEHGCPNICKVWNGERFIKVYECRECGSTYEDVSDAAMCCDELEPESCDGEDCEDCED